MDDIRRSETIEERDGESYLVVKDGVTRFEMKLTDDQLNSREPVGRRLGLIEKIDDGDGTHSRVIGPVAPLYLDALILFGCPGYVTDYWMVYPEFLEQSVNKTASR